MTDIRLETARLKLRPPNESDSHSWAALDADREATRFIGGVQTPEQSRAGLETVMRMWAQQGCGLFSVIDLRGEWIGRVGPWVPKGHIGTEIGWAIARPSWGNGYAVEAATAAMTWAFETLGWSDVIHCIDSPNEASITVARRLGSQWLREQRGADGKTVQIYGQRREQWLASAR